MKKVVTLEILIFEGSERFIKEGNHLFFGSSPYSGQKSVELFLAKKLRRHFQLKVLSEEARMINPPVPFRLTLLNCAAQMTPFVFRKTGEQVYQYFLDV